MTMITEEINSLIMEQASETAEKMAGLEWKKDQRPDKFWIEDIDGTERMNEEAQDIFNVYYDQQTEELTKLVTECLKLYGKK